jgi:4-alpha-glucanotransferase
MNDQSKQKFSVSSGRSAGILLHPTSLPCTESSWESEEGFGTLGQAAFSFIDFMAASGLTVWQVLPLGPTQKDLSPYQSLSVHAGNPNLINLQNLVERGWIPPIDQKLEDTSPDGIHRFRHRCAQSFLSFINSEQGLTTSNEFKDFCLQNAYWLDDFVLFCALRAHFNYVSWVEWPEQFRWRDTQALNKIREELDDEINIYRFEQFAFAVQWQALKEYANQKNIFIFGDMPIFVAHDSADVWAQPHYFKLDESGNPLVMAGVPPDSFSESGQCWGNPIYNWNAMQQDGFQWWLARFRSQSAFFDLMRIDHFRGLEAYWEIPADKKDARKGEWIKAPGEALLQTLRDAYPDLVLVAENLGMITDEVELLRSKFNLTGMLVLHFAFENDVDNSHLPHRHSPNNIIYTGTHDNNTTIGWYKDLTESGRQQLVNYSFDSSIPMPWLLINIAFSSVCNLAIIPMQDFLALDEKSRMNMPASTDGNWRWRFSWQQVSPELAQSINDTVKKYHRVFPSS